MNGVFFLLMICSASSRCGESTGSGGNPCGNPALFFQVAMIDEFQDIDPVQLPFFVSCLQIPGSTGCF